MTAWAFSSAGADICGRSLFFVGRDETCSTREYSKLVFLLVRCSRQSPVLIFLLDAPQEAALVAKGSKVQSRFRVLSGIGESIFRFFEEFRKDGLREGLLSKITFI